MDLSTMKNKVWIFWTNSTKLQNDKLLEPSYPMYLNSFIAFERYNDMKFVPDCKNYKLSSKLIKFKGCGQRYRVVDCRLNCTSEDKTVLRIKMISSKPSPLFTRFVCPTLETSVSLAFYRHRDTLLSTFC